MNQTTQPPPVGSGRSKGVETLLGNPKTAILRLSIPMIVAMSVQTLYNFVDAFWVSGLGPDALSAVGFFFPFFFLIIALSTGLGVGSAAALSRFIGSGDKGNAERVASHSMVITGILSLMMSLPLFFLAPKLMAWMGAGRVAGEAAAYSGIMFAGCGVLLFSNIAGALLRGEGAVKRAMSAMLLGAALNIILDPLFIYVFRLGVAGAAWATIISLSISSLLLASWFFYKPVTFVRIRFRGFRFDGAIVRDIMRVGIPSALMQMIMSLSMFALNALIVKVGGTDGIAVFTTGWRVVMFAILPLIGMATAVTSVTGAAFGGKEYEKMNSAYQYALKIGTLIEICVALLTYFLAPLIAGLFTHSAEGLRIRADLIVFLRTMCIYYPATAFGMLTSSMFQGGGRGIPPMVIALLRTIVFTVPAAYFFSQVLGTGLRGIWWGIGVSNIAGALIAWLWGKQYLLNIRRELFSATSP